MTLYNQPLVVPGSYTIAQAVALGVLPLNATLTSVNGVAIGAGVPCPTVMQIMSAGNQGVSLFGASIAQNGAIAQQAFVDGIATANATLSTGPAPNNTSTLPQAPVTAATLCSNLSFTGQYGG